MGFASASLSVAGGVTTSDPSTEDGSTSPIADLTPSGSRRRVGLGCSWLSVTEGGVACEPALRPSRSRSSPGTARPCAFSSADSQRPRPRTCSAETNSPSGPRASASRSCPPGSSETSGTGASSGARRLRLRIEFEFDLFNTRGS